MNLKKWALISEIVGAAAIVVSLIFVGLQVRDASSATYAGTYDRLLADLVYWRMELATSPNAMRGWEAISNPDGAENQDPVVFQAGRFVVESAVQIFERAYYARFYGRLNDEEWSRFQRRMCNPQLHEVWARANLNGNLFSQEFWQYVSKCSPE
jgi:hypothetical protein